MQYNEVRRSTNYTIGGDERRTLSDESGSCPIRHTGLNTCVKCAFIGTQVGDCYYDPAGNLTISRVHNDIDYKPDKVDISSGHSIGQATQRK